LQRLKRLDTNESRSTDKISAVKFWQGSVAFDVHDQGLEYMVSFKGHHKRNGYSDMRYILLEKPDDILKDHVPYAIFKRVKYRDDNDYTYYKMIYRYDQIVKCTVTADIPMTKSAWASWKLYKKTYFNRNELDKYLFACGL